jgi:hypothetical protein
MRAQQYQDIHEPDLTDPRYKHGDAGKGTTASLYRVWANIKFRCYNKDGRDYPFYGGKGIRVHRPWLDYLVFRVWAKANGHQEGLVLFRTDRNKDFQPGNCVWMTKAKATTKINGRRRRFTWGQVTSIRESNASMNSLAKVYGVCLNTIAKIKNFKTYQEELTDNGQV